MTLPWLTEARAILGKDLATEFRTRFALSAVGLFAVTTLAFVGFAVGNGGLGSARLEAAVLWVLLFFAAVTGLMRGFVAEEDARTADGLRLAASPVGVLLGKLGFNLLLLLALASLMVPGFTLLLGLGAEDVQYGLLAATLALGVWGLAAALTLTAALVARARARGALGAVVAFPLLIPLLNMVVDITANALVGQAGSGDLLGPLAYAGIMTTLGLLLFEYVWQA